MGSQRKRRQRRIPRRPLLGGLAALALVFAPGPAAADPTVSTATDFTPADGTRTYMDIGGAWDGTTDVSLAGNGDVFSATLTNADDEPDEAAQDLTLAIALPTAFDYQTASPLAVGLSGAGCGAVPAVQVTDNGSSLDVDFDGTVEAYDLPDDCAITVTFELIAGSGASTGSNLVEFQWNYVNGGPQVDSQSVDVRAGDPALSFDEITKTGQPGDILDWEITVSNEGAGGLFAVEIDQTSVNNNPSVGLQLQPPLTQISAPRPISLNAAGDIATIPYLGPGESFTIGSDTLIETCNNLNNEAISRNKLSDPDPDPISAQVLLDLDNPELAYTPLSGSLDYSGPVSFSIPVSNTGTGTAFDVSIATNIDTAGGPAVNVVSTSGGWAYLGGGVFEFQADIGAGAGNLPAGGSTTLVVELEAADVETDLGGGTIEYTPDYENICGTTFQSPTDSGTLGDSQPVPATGAGKTASVTELGIGSGDPASYDVNFTASFTELIQDGDFTVTDTLPAELVSPSITAPAGTTASCGGGPFQTGTQSCSPGDLVEWNIPSPGSGAAAETLTIDFTAPEDACLGGTTLTNTADVQPATSTQSCTVDGGSGSAGILLANVPDPENSDAFSFDVPGGPFETGQPDNGDCSQATGEGECIPHEVSYSFPSPYPGVWRDPVDGENSRFTDDFGGLAGQTLVPGTVEVDLLENGVSTTGGFTPAPGGAVLDGTGQLVLDLGFLADAGFFDDNNVGSTTADREIRIRYSTTVPDSELGPGDSLAVGIESQLLIKNGAGGSGACEGTLPDPDDVVFTVPASFEVERAAVDAAVSRIDGATTADVCEVMPVRIDLDNGNGQQAADLFTRLATGGSDYSFLARLAFGGQFNDTFLVEDTGAASGPTWEFADPEAELTGGTIDVEVRLEPGAATGFGAGTPLTAEVEYDDNETTLSPSVGGTPTSGRAFATSAGFTPTEVRQGDLTIQATPQQLFVTGSQVEWTIFLTNGGTGAAYDVRLRNEIPTELGLNVAATNAASGSCGGEPLTATNPAGSLLQWDITQVPAATTCEITVVADVTDSTGCSIPDGSSRIAGEWGCGGTFVQQGDLAGPYSDPMADDSPNFRFAEPELRLEHTTAFCELCDVTGVVELLVRNIGASRIEDVEVIEELPTGVGIDLVPGSVEFSTDGGVTFNPAPDPAPVGPAGQYRFTQAEIPNLAELFTLSESGGGSAEVIIRYNITSDESTLPGPHTIQASAQGDRPCDGLTFNFGPRADPVDVHQPDITVTKTGVNDTIDRTGDPEFVVGLPGETITWTIGITNNGLHNTRQTRLRDVLLDAVGSILADRTSDVQEDSLVLDSPALASPIPINDSGGGFPDEEDYVFDPGDDALPTIAPGETVIYTLTETLGGNCFNADNQADLTWGCVDNADGDPSNLPNSVSQQTDPDDTARLLMVPDFSADDAIQQSFTARPGGRTEVTLTLRNDGAPAEDMVVRNNLPAGLRIDTSFTPVIGGSGGQTLNSVDTSSGAPGDPGSPNHPRIILDGALGFGETTTVTFQAIQDTAFDTDSDPFTDPETAPTLDPDPPASGPNDVFIEFSASDLCDTVSPPPATDSETLDPQTPDIDLDPVTPSPVIVADGETVTFTFVATNEGDLDSIGAPLEFRLDSLGGGWINPSVNVTNPGPGGLGGACAATAPFTCSASRLGTLQRGDQATVEVTVTASDNGSPLTLIGTIEGSVVESGGGDNGDDFSFDRARPVAVGFEISKTLTATSEPYTGENLAANTADLAIGEEGSWDLRARWFGIDTAGGEAVESIALRDSLGTAIGFVGQTDNSTGVTVTPTAPAPVNGGDINYAVGDITAGGGGTFLFDLTGRLLNIGSTDKGDIIANRFDASFTVDYGGTNTFDFAAGEFGGSDTELSSDAEVTAVEPTLTFTKEVRNITDGLGFQDADPPDRLPADGNDVVEYRVTVANEATGSDDAPVFGIIVDDPLTTNEIILDPASSGIDTDGDGAVDVSCGDYTAGPPDRIVFDRDTCAFGAAGTNLDQLDPGQSVTILYQGTVQITANPGELLDNGADLTAWSLIDPAPQDASHEGNQTSPVGTKGDTDGARGFDDDDVAGVIIENNTAIEKTACGPANSGTPVCSIASTSPLGDGGDGEQDLRVGDSLRYQIVVDLAPQATIENFEIADTLPPGFEFTGDVSNFDSQQIDFSAGNPDPPDPVAGATQHTWSFGTIQVTGDDPQIRFDYEVVTVDDPDPGFGGGNEIPAPGTSLDQDNAGELSFDEASGTFTQIDAARVDVPQPQLEVSKTSNPSSPATVGENDPVEYTVTVTNNGDAPAYDPVVEDILAEGMRGTVGIGDAITTISIDVGGAGKNLVAPTDPGGDFLADGQARWTLPSIPGGGAGDYTIAPGESLVLVYQADVNDDIGANRDLSNAATATRWFSFDDDDPPAGTVASDRREYGPSNTDTADLRSSSPTNVDKQNPAATSATIGEELTYTLQVPADPASLNVAIYDTVITDVLPEDTTFVGADFLGGGASGTPAFNYDPGTNTLTIQDATDGIDILPGNAAVFEVTVRVENTVDTNAGDSIVNTARYDYSSVDDDGTRENSGGPDVTTPSITLTEPLIQPTKQARNTSAGDTFGGAFTPPDAGDVVEYCLGFPAAAGAIRSDAFDLAFSDTLPAGTTFQSGTAQLADANCSPGNPGGNTLQAPAVSGQTLDWTRAAGNDVDVPAGAAVSVLYRVSLDDTVAPLTVLTNAAAVEWTSLDGDEPDERSFDAATNPPNDYRATTDTSFDSGDTTQLAKVEASTPPLGNGGDGDGDYRLGERVTYRIEITDLTEGTLDGFTVTDTLPEGLEFEAGSSVITQGGAITPDPTGVGATVVSGTGAPGDPQTIAWNFGDLVNDGEVNNGFTPDTLFIEYSALVREDAPPTEDAANDVTLSYLDGAANPIERTQATTIDIVAPSFDTPVKSTTVPTAPATVDAGTTVPYTVELANTGGAPAYDVVVEDVIPEGMRADALAAGTITATLVITDAGGTTISGPRSVNGTFPGSFDTDGRVQWDIDTGAGDDRVPAGGTLTLEYSVDIDDDAGPGLQMTNAAGGLRWFTIDPDAPPSEGTPVELGPGPTASVTVQTPTPGPLTKASTTLESTMGDTVVYRLRVPDSSFGAALFDVVVTDPLPTEVEFLSAEHAPTSGVSEPLDASVDGANVLTIVSATDPDGFDIPAGDVAVIDVTVRHNDIGGGVAGDIYTNDASYTWERTENGTDDLDGGAASSHSVDVVEPELVFTKNGPATIGRAGGSFTLAAENIGDAAAYDTVVTDVLPADMRDTQPVLDAVEITGPGGTRTLSEGTDYSVAWDGATGTLTLTFESASAAIGGVGTSPAGETLSITYTAFLDDDATDGATLTNVAGTTRHATQDGTGGSFPEDTRVYTFALSDGTPGTADHEDEHTTTSEAPVIEVDKAVDVSTALPGQTLTYTITVDNTGSGDARVDITDDFGALDADDVYLPGSLTVTSPPASFGTNATDPNGGTAGKGLIDFRDVVVPAAGSAVVVATIDTRPVVSDGDRAINQGSVADRFFDITEPTDDPATADDDDPTETVFGAEPDLIVTKRDADLTGDPDVLAVGDTIEYTIEVENVGTESLVNSVLTDAVPGNTTYVPGSTTLNGVPVPDAGSGSDPRSQLEDGLTINDPGSAAGTLTAQSGNAATVTFRVTVDPDLLEGTVISNQAVVTAEGTGSGVVPTEPSDDPDTPIVGDPTQSIVGAAALIDVQKTVVSSTNPVQSGPTPPSSELTYTIIVSNDGTAPATGTILTDDVPANAGYVPGSTTLNGVAVPDAPGSASPLATAAGGLPVSSSDLVPPGALPDPASATVNPGESATIVFRVTVDDGLANGTVISNQGSVASDQQPGEPTDADGNDENGDQPTTVIVGGEPVLKISKEVFVVGGGTIQADGLLDYAVRVENIGPVDAANVTITDDLDAPVPGQLEYIPGSGRLDGASGPVSFVDPVVQANAGTLQPGEATELRFRARVDNGLALGTTIDNTGRVTADGGVDETASVAIDVGGAPGVANLNGTVWLDNDLDDLFDSGDERPLEDWQIAVRFNGRTIGAVDSAADGRYALRGLAPGGEYTLRFTFPGQTTTFGETAAALGTTGRQVITAISLDAGANVLDEDMPVTANGTVYDSIARTPLGGATVTLLDTNTGAVVAAGCFADSTQQGQVTAGNGLYLLELEFTDPSCPDPGDYLIEITPPPGGGAPSRIIPPTTDGTTAPYDVAACPDDAISPAPPGGLCEAQPQDTPPGTSVSAGPGTRYYLNLTFAGSGNAAQMHNHHLPVDPDLGDSVTLTKTTPLVDVVRGQLVPYTITATNQLAGPLPDTEIVDTIPPGFKYIEGSAIVDGDKVEPEIDGLELTWPDLTLPSNESFEIKLILVVGGGVGEGEYVNRARVRNEAVGADASREATATVRVVPDPTFDCTDIIGKVFDDRNADGRQDEGEPGLGGVRLTTARGLLITTDRHGRYHVTCAAVPDRDRGSNFILKLDERTLPSGYRTTTENPRVVRATRGKMVRLNFGATIHQVVRLDLAGAAFMPARAELRPEWRDRLEPLYEQLAEGPSVLRLSYLGDGESERLAERRLGAIRERIADEWARRNGEYDLRIETELFWRRGRPGGSE